MNHHTRVIKGIQELSTLFATEAVGKSMRIQLQSLTLPANLLRCSNVTPTSSSLKWGSSVGSFTLSYWNKFEVKYSSHMLYTTESQHLQNPICVIRVKDRTFSTPSKSGLMMWLRRRLQYQSSRLFYKVLPSYIVVHF